MMGQTKDKNGSRFITTTKWKLTDNGCPLLIKHAAIAVFFDQQMLFLKEVAVNIQHCAVIKNEEQCSTLKFIIAKCSQEVLPYRFKEREGVFNPHTQYGTIKCKQFSIFGETASAGQKILHMARMLYKQRTASPLSVNFHLVVVMNLEPFYQVICI